MYVKLFLEEVEKKINNEHLIELFKDYLKEVDDDCRFVKYIIDKNDKLKKYEDVLISCHKIFMSSQKMIDDLSCKDITPYENRDMDIVMCFTFYSSVYIILKSHLPTDLYLKISNIYEDANLIMNIPRDDAEENKDFFEILRKYIGDYFLPIKMSSDDVVIDEYDYGLLYFINMKVNEKLPEYLKKKKEFQNFDYLKTTEEITKKLKPELSKEIINLSLFQ